MEISCGYFVFLSFEGSKIVAGKKQNKTRHTLTLHYVLKDLQPWNLLSYAGKILHDFIKYTNSEGSGGRNSLIFHGKTHK